MDYTFKPSTRSPQMPTKISRAIRETDPAIFVPVSTEVPNSQRAPPTKAAPSFTDVGPSWAPRPFPPHIMIYPWDGSFWSKQEFINQLLAQAYFHPDETRNDRERMVWAISHFQGHAAYEAGEFMARLTGEYGHLVGDLGAKARKIRAIWTPDTWEKFLYFYLEDIGEKVARRREWWIVKMMRLVWILVCMIVRLLMWCAVVVLGAGLLVQLSAVAAENSDVFWTWTRGRILPIV